MKNSCNIAAAVLFGGLTIHTCVAQTPSIAISVPAHGSTFDAASPFYIPGSDEILVSGAVDGITSITAPAYVVLVQGIAVSLTFNPPNASTSTFQIRLPAGPTPPPTFYGGNWPSFYPYRADWMDISHTQKPLLAEIYQLATSKVVARTRIVAYDKRWDSGLQVQYSGSKIPDAMRMEMSFSGLDALQRTHAETLPQPDRPQFNTVLTNNFTGQSESLANINTNIGDNAKACIPLNQADPAFRSTAAYTAASAAANAQLLAYEFARNWTPVTPVDIALKALILGTACVKQRVNAADFEICAQTVKGTSRDLQLNSVESSDLEIGSASPIEAQVRLGRLSGAVDGELRDLFIRYAKNTALPCLAPTLRPKADIDNTTLASTPALAAWAACPNLAISAQSPQTPNWLPYLMTQSTGNIEQILMQAGTPLSPVFDLGANRSVNANRGTCGDPQFEPYARTMLLGFFTPMRIALDNSWKNGSPNTQQAIALDKLFTPWEPGVYADQPPGDHTMTLEYTPSNQPARLPANRLWASFSSDVQARPGVRISPASPLWVYSPPGDYPCMAEMNVMPIANCLPGRGFFMNPFQTSYSVTTGGLNQVLKELSNTARLTFELRPTYNDLAIAPPSGHTGTERPVLDGPLLKQLATPFGDLGATQVQIILTPTFVPFTWIFPDPVGVPPGRGSLTYQLVNFYVDLIGNTPGPTGSTRWMRLLVDFYDPNFNLSLHPNPARNLLQPAMSGTERWTYTILESQFTSCPLSPMTINTPPFVFNTCGATMATALGNLVQPPLNNSLIAMLSRYPAPLTYDATGLASPPKRVIQTEKYQWDQVITFYSNFQ